MATRLGALLLAAALLPLAVPVLAGPEQELRAASGSFSEDSFSEDTVRTMSDGRVFKRHVEQKTMDDGFSRKEVLTSPEGRSASYVLIRRYDATSQRWTRREEGTGFDGRQWSRTEQGEPELLVFGDPPRRPEAPANLVRPAEKPASPATPTGPKRREFR